MFTGIITDVGTIVRIEEIDQGRRIFVQSTYDLATIDLGASIACAGVCLTVVDKGQGPDDAWFAVEAWEEALRLTTAAHWRSGTRLNLERSLKIGDELGGHLVSGHVDGQALISRRREEGGAVRFELEAPAELGCFIAQKGSVALDGTSLTVNSVNNNQFNVLLIAHSLSVTTWAERQTNDVVNLEVDLMARYAARLAQAAQTQ